MKLQVNEHGKVVDKELFELVALNFSNKFDVIFSQYENDVSCEGLTPQQIYIKNSQDVTRDLMAWADEYRETTTDALEQHYIDFYKHCWAENI